MPGRIDDDVGHLKFIESAGQIDRPRRRTDDDESVRTVLREIESACKPTDRETVQDDGAYD